MLKRIALAACLMILTVPFAADADATETYNLRQRFEPGTYWISTFINSDQTIAMAAQPMQQKIKQMMIMKLHVGEPDENGKKKATLNYERIVQNMTVAGQKVKYDSANPDASSPLARSLQPMTEVTFTMVIKKDNEIEKVTGFSEMLEKMSKNNPQAAQVLAQMKDSFGDEQIKQMISQGTQGLPDKAIAVGETWKEKTEIPIPMAGTISLDSHYKLDDVISKAGGKLAKIAYQGKGDLQSIAAPGNLPLEFSKMDITQNGTVLFNVAQGRMVRSDLTQSMDMSAKAGQASQPGQQAPQEMTLNISQTSRTVMLQSTQRNTEAEQQFVATGSLPKAD